MKNKTKLNDESLKKYVGILVLLFTLLIIVL
uniref:Uncharacterized protein n=1 Tax=viral metagenome TaxID=1070528 RepID=A0A6C0KKW2_9ZZZZ